MDNIQRLRRIITKIYGSAAFETLLEAVMNEAWVSLSDWEGNEGRWGKNESGEKSGRTVTVTSDDFIHTGTFGASIVKGDYVF